MLVEYHLQALRPAAQLLRQLRYLRRVEVVCGCDQLQATAQHQVRCDHVGRVEAEVTLKRWDGGLYARDLGTCRRQYRSVAGAGQCTAGADMAASWPTVDGMACRVLLVDAWLTAD